MEKTKAKRSVSLFLALVLLIALLPGSAFTLPAQAETDPLIGDDEVVEELRYENTRLGMATLLYHMAGEPTMDTVVLNSYTDLEGCTEYERSAIVYVLENEITTGTSRNTFGPAYHCTRGEAAVFLWRAAGSPEPIVAECPYTDVKNGAFYYKAICWTLEKQGWLDFCCEGLSFDPNGVFVGYQLFKVASDNPWRLRILMKASLVTGECGENLTWTFDPSTGLLSIEGSGDMTNYNSSVHAPWYAYREGITGVSLPEGLTRIGNYAFCNCAALPEITISATVTSIGVNAFRGCSSLEAIHVSPENLNYSSIDGVLFNKSGTWLYQYPAGKKGEYVVPKDVNIREGAFTDCVGLTGVTIPEGVTSLSSNTFFNCSALTTVLLPESLTIIDDNAFYACSALTQIQLPEGLQRIGHYAFIGCEQLSQILIPASVTEIGDYAFAYCNNQTSAVILSKDAEIGEESFGYAYDYENADPEAEFNFIKIEGYTIYGLADSTAKIYAEENGFLFVELTPCDYGNHDYQLISEVVHTELEPGLQTWQCTMCGDEYTVQIPAGHVWVCIQQTNLWNGTMSCTVCGASQEGDTSTELILDQESTVPMGQEVNFVWFRFTPEVSGQYVLEQLDGGTLFGEAYTADGQEFGETGIAGGYGIFGFKLSLEAGQTYYFQAKDSYGTDPDWVTVKLRLYEAPLSGECGDGLFWSFDEEAHTLTITGTGEMYAYYGVPNFEAPWMDHRENIYRVLLPEGLTNIGGFAFDLCGNLRSVELPASVKSVGGYAFSGCDALEDVYYGGDENAWQQISHEMFGAEALRAARVHYNTPTETDHWNQVSVIPTCTEKGLEGERCACGYARNERELPALGHDFVDGVCTRCGKEQEASDIFTDLKPGAFYTEAVNWAVKNNVTSGTSATTFSPNKICTRGQVVTFLWRAYGEPEPTVTTHPFTDVKENGFYYKAMLWAVEKGITSGTSATTFGPGKDCTRAQVVTFLWRAAGSPEPTSTQTPFTDLKPKASYYKAVLWAVENGITTGTSGTTFSPSKTCTRGQVVTFLYRAMAVAN